MRLSRKQSSLRGRLALLVTLAIIPALIVSIYSSFRLREQTAAHARSEVELLAQGAAAQLGVAGHEADELVHYVQLAFRDGRFTPAVCASRLRALLDLHDQFTNISVVDGSGRVRCSGMPFATASEQAGQSARGMPVGRSRMTHAGDLAALSGPADRFVFSAPLGTGQKDAGLYVRAAIRTRWFDDLLASFSLPRGYSIFLLDVRNHVIAAAADDRPFVGKTALLDCAQASPGCMGDAGVFSSPGLDGMQRLFAYSAVGNLPVKQSLRVFVGMPESQLVAAQRTELAHHLGALALAGGLFFLIAWAGTSRLLIGPLGALGRTARRLGKGDLSVRAILPRVRELAVLSKSFNEMADQIEARSEQAEVQVEKIQQLLRVYQVINAINDAILHITDRDELAQEACRIVVEQGNFPMAWIGLVDRDSGEVRPVARAGGAQDLVDRFKISIAEDAPEGRGSVGVAIRNGAPCVVRDLRESPNMAPWQRELLANGCLSVGTFPLTAAADHVGNLTIYARTADAFSTEDVELFARTAAEIGFAMAHMQIESELDKVLKFDTVTGLPNRSLFKDSLTDDINHAKHGGSAVAILLMQVQELDRITDAEGHHHADAMMRAVTRYLREQTRTEDSLAMVGTDTFALEVVEASEAELFHSCSRLVSLFPKSMYVLGTWMRISIRAGASYFPHDGADAETLLRNAEFALHSSSEESAKTYTFYSRASDERAHRRFVLERALHEAIDNGELSLVYQPVFDLYTRRMVGVEALCRWDSPEFGSVSPGEFIPIAERAGLIEAIGLWVLRNSCCQARDWKAEFGEAPCVAMNVSLIQLHRPEFLDDVRRVLQAAGIDPKDLPLTIEITESETSYHMEETIGILHQIREMGFSVYVDDFGTGYSSLSYLKRLPVDVLKVDRVFIKDLGTAESDAGFVKLLVDLARSLSLKIVAEGVETEAQLRVLEELGCDMVQGFLLGKPMTADRAAEIFHKSSGAQGVSGAV